MIQAIEAQNISNEAKIKSLLPMLDKIGNGIEEAAKDGYISIDWPMPYPWCYQERLLISKLVEAGYEVFSKDDKSGESHAIVISWENA